MQLANVKLLEVGEALARRVVQLEEDGAVEVERLGRDDRRAARVLRQPRLEVEDHAIHRHPAASALVVAHDVGPAVDLDALLEGAELARARLLERPALQRGGGCRKLGQRLHVEGVRVGRASVGRLEEEQHAVERGAVDIDVGLGRRAARVAHRLRQANARLEQPAVHGKELAVSRRHQHRILRRPLGWRDDVGELEAIAHGALGRTRCEHRRATHVHTRARAHEAAVAVAAPDHATARLVLRTGRGGALVGTVVVVVVGCLGQRAAGHAEHQLRAPLGHRHDEDLVVRYHLVEQPLADAAAEHGRVLHEPRAFQRREHELRLDRQAGQLARAATVVIGRQLEGHPLIVLILAHVQAEPLRLAQQHLALRHLSRGAGAEHKVATRPA
mmetsp:Transcript_45300/g.118920  ORF Transcript_45300/g.118920 Transcript_45300/m.118920 type:complete len:387 (-) Transcript_45300:276-1436(-)